MPPEGPSPGFEPLDRPTSATPGEIPVPPDASAPPPILDHELIRLIARGSYGEVWLARSALGTLRAVKIVHRQTFWHDHPFEREFKGIQKFEPISRSHEGLVDILQVGRGEGFFYYVMELADVAGGAESDQGSVIGDRSQAPPACKEPAASLITDHGLPITDYSPRTLTSELQTRGRLPAAEVIRIGLTLTGALEHLHGHGLVHRDVKPSNVIFVEGVPKLADIGMVAEVSEARSYVGTEGFIPPEGPGSAQADLYSLGKLLYEISTGKDRHEFPALPPDLDTLPDKPALIELNAVLLQACDPDPRQRHASAAAMRVELELLQQGGSVRRRRVTQHRVALARRAALVLGGLALLGVLGFLLLSAMKRPGSGTVANAADPVSIFVLPFRNPAPYLHRPTTDEIANEICARMTDALIDALAGIDGVRVGPRKSGWIFEPEEILRRRAAQPPYRMAHAICGHLEITNAWVSGRVEHYETGADRVLWSTNFLVTTNEVIALERGILKGLALTLDLRISPEVEARVDHTLSNNWAAYLKYVKARSHYEEWTPAGYTLAMEAYHQALELDPHYPDARLGVVATRRQLAESRDAPRRVWPDMRTGLHEVLAMDDTCYRARYWLASLQISHDYNWKEGMAAYDQLIERNPADHLAWALYYRWLGRRETAHLEQTLAEQAYPLDATVLDHAPAARYVERDYRGCLHQSQHVSLVRPDLGLGASYWVARASIELGEFSEALAAIGRLRQVEPIPELLALEGRAYALMGQPGKAHEVLAQLEHQSSYVSPYFVAWVHAALNDKSAALAALERACTDRSERLVNSDYGGLRTDPAWDGLRDDPQFEALCQRVGLGEDQWPR